MKRKNIMKATLGKMFFLAVTVSTVAAQDSLVQKQKDLLGRLAEIDLAETVGFSVNGSAKSGYQNVSLSSDQIPRSDSVHTGSPTNETQAYTEANIIFSARPSKKSVARVEFRVHQDWQKGHEQGVNPILVHWWSYDGLSLDDKLKFNLGDMRVAYTPLTINTPSIDLIQEPEIFRARRQEVMRYLDLDGSNGRLMQGLNADYQSGSVLGGVLENVQIQGTIARLRNNAKKPDQVFFDFDQNDRYAMGTRMGVTAYGANIGMNYIDVFDRISSSRTVELNAGDSVDYDQNSVLSLQLGFDSQSLLPSKLFNVGLNLEYAMSNWTLEHYHGYVDYTSDYYVLKDGYVSDGVNVDTTVYVVLNNTKQITIVEKYGETSLDGKALRVNLTGALNLAGFDVDMNVNYLNNDTNFQSDLAMTPSYIGNQAILNSGVTFEVANLSSSVLDQIRSGSLENMYFSIYQSNSQTKTTILGKPQNGTVNTEIPSESEDYRLFNNYRMSQYYRNGYFNSVLKRSELLVAMAELDPSMNLALPFGYATPDRKGLDLNLAVTWNHAVTLNLLLAMLDNTQKDTLFQASYQRIGLGLGVDIAELVAFFDLFKVQLSYDQTQEDGYYNRTYSRMMAGFDAGIWKGLSLVGGFQLLSKEFDRMILTPLSSTDEMLILVGPKLRITAGSYVSLQYGFMKNTVKYSYDEGTDLKTSEFDISKHLLTADFNLLF